jgi:hypothetical protein
MSFTSVKTQLSFIFLFLMLFNSNAQEIIVADSLKPVNLKLRRGIVLGGLGGYTAGSLLFLDLIWYRQYQTTSFHFYNDNSQWCQMDKFGHAFTTYNSGRLIMQAMKWAGFKSTPFNAGMGHLLSESMKWAGFNKRQSIIFGEAFGILYMSSIEILDGFSSGWGFSWGDELANFAGSGFFIAQQYFWNEQRVQLKFSFHPTGYAKYRPNILGSYPTEQIIKDYNGQTYWLSFNVASFLKKETKFPKWLSVSFGYGAEDMISGKDNYFVVNGSGDIIGKNRYRKYFFSLDIDFTKIKTKSPFLKTVFSVINCFKVPFPAIEYNKHGISGHPLYF